MATFDLLELDLNQDFINSFTTSGGATGDCHCGREHICINTEMFTGEYEDYGAELRNNARTNKNLILHEEWDCLSTVEVDGKYFIGECECKGWEPYMIFMLRHRREITDFLIQVSDAVDTALAHEKTIERLTKVYNY